MRERAQPEVAWHRLDPGIRDQDHRLFEIVVGETDALEHGPRTSPLHTVEQGTAHVPNVECAVSVCAVAACHSGAPCLPLNTRTMPMCAGICSLQFRTVVHPRA